MSWTDERVELLRKLWTEGHSASQISAELGLGVTRNAVIGKVHRLGLSGRPKTANAATPMTPRERQAPRRQPSRPSAPATRGNLALSLQTRPMAERTPRPMEQVVIPISERVTLMELKESMCRWPLGDPSTQEFRFCGNKSPSGGGPYCAYHARIAYQPAQDRRRDRDREKRAMLRHG